MRRAVRNLRNDQDASAETTASAKGLEALERLHANRMGKTVVDDYRLAAEATIGHHNLIATTVVDHNAGAATKGLRVTGKAQGYRQRGDGHQSQKALLH